jgi:hypothetical protein
MKKQRHRTGLPVGPRFEEIAQILCHCEQLKCYITSYYGENARSYREIFSNGTMLGNANVYFFQLYIVKLCMILHDTQDYYFKRVVEDIIKDGNTHWREKTSKAELEKVADSLLDIENQILDTLRRLRDKFIAHRDFYRELENASFGYKIAWEVLQNLQDLYNIVDLHAFNRTMQFDRLSSQEPGEYRHLSRYAKLWQKLRPEWANPKDRLTLDLTYLVRGKTPPDVTGS